MTSVGAANRRDSFFCLFFCFFVFVFLFLFFCFCFRFFLVFLVEWWRVLNGRRMGQVNGQAKLWSVFWMLVRHDCGDWRVVMYKRVGGVGK